MGKPLKYQLPFSANFVLGLSVLSFPDYPGCVWTTQFPAPPTPVFLHPIAYAALETTALRWCYNLHSSSSYFPLLCVCVCVCVLALAHEHWWEKLHCSLPLPRIPQTHLGLVLGLSASTATLASVFSLIFAPPLAFCNFPQT